MRLSKPRVEPLDPELWNEDLHPLRDAETRRGGVANIYRTLAHHPKLLKRWSVFGNHVLNKSSLPARERELLILRIGWLCRSGYEWGQHVRIARAAGLGDEEIERVAQGPEAAGWSEPDRLLLRAVDELHDDAFISDETWRGLAERWTTEQLMDVVFAVGQYNLVSMALNTLGVQAEAKLASVPGLPDGPTG